MMRTTDRPTPPRPRQAWLMATLWMLAMASGLPLRGQEIVSFDVPHDLCAGQTVQVTMGYRTTNNVVLESYHTSVGHSGTSFLPDGERCNGTCAYRSPVVFSGFPASSVITSANDIRFVRLNIEHSFLGDLYIGITCPNGQKADILRFSNYSSNPALLSSCLSDIPTASRGWATPSSSNHDHAYLGLPNTAYNEYDNCSPTAANNGPGTGWNYCWSNNTGEGYSYASGGGLVYRSANQQYVERVGSSNYYRVDSSHVHAGTHFYHPDQSFANLVGCPINGQWTITVLDGVKHDNGYIFEWELALDESLIPSDNCTADEYIVAGHGVARIDDSTFTITAPEHVVHDSTVTYTYMVVSTCGDTIVRTAMLTFHPTYDNQVDMAGCGQCTWQGHTFTESTQIATAATTAQGCDSNTHVNIVVHPVYHLSISDAIVENDLPYSFMGHTFTQGVTDSLIAATTADGCDSNISFTLTVYPNRSTETSRTLCSDETPLLWNGLTLTETADTTVTLATSFGADSVVTLHLTVHPTDATSLDIEAVENDLPVDVFGTACYASTDSTKTFTNIHGCDSVVHLHLTVHPNHHYTLSHSVCDDALPTHWQGHDFDGPDTIVMQLADIHGADSTVTLMFGVNPTYSTTIDTTICDNHPFQLGNTTLVTDGIYDTTFATTAGCDSSVALVLHVKPHNETHLFDTICANSTYTFGDNSYSQSGNYLYTYTNIHGCDSTITLHLGILADELQACIKADPLMVTRQNPQYTLRDCSHYTATRQWTVDGISYQAPDLELTFPDDADSVSVNLVAISIEGCTDTAQATIRIDRSAIATPNAFTPSQGTNSTWQPALVDIEAIEIWIYNRDGLLVAHLEGADASWDGTSQGRPCPQGAYVYNIVYRTTPRPGQTQRLTGTILLLR